MPPTPLKASPRRRDADTPAWKRALADPRRAISVAASLLRGQWYKRYYRLRGIRFTAGRNFRVQGRLTVRGPGRVVFGDDVTVAMHVTPWTHAPEAVIAVGDRAILNGTRMGCRREITIGSDALIADAHILDTDFHSTWKDRRSPDAPVRVAPVRLGKNVWVASSAGVLPGTSIGETSWSASARSAPAAIRPTSSSPAIPPAPSSRFRRLCPLKPRRSGAAVARSTAA
ncbi:MAG: hypothetical protein KF709_12000 [Gemmatimonadaceae bacterium]|nr:hypothetical protein [Gemmatimonadaceae bacterium]